jgi:hypothetical protein
VGAETLDGTNEEMLTRLREVVAGEPQGSAARLERLPERVIQILATEEHRAREMGEMANQILQQIDQIRLARADLELAAQTLHYSRRLEEKGFITSNELQRDEINHERQLAARTLAWNDLFLVVNCANGPGHPAAVKRSIDAVSNLIGKKPIFGICLGHQILSIVFGARTHKMPFGHHGANHRVRDIATKKVEITLPEPLVREGRRAHARQPERPDRRGDPAQEAAGLLHPVPPRGRAGPARLLAPLPALPATDPALG